MKPPSKLKDDVHVRGGIYQNKIWSHNWGEIPVFALFVDLETSSLFNQKSLTVLTTHNAPIQSHYMDFEYVIAGVKFAVDECSNEASDCTINREPPCSAYAGHRSSRDL